MSKSLDGLITTEIEINGIKKKVAKIEGTASKVSSRDGSLHISLVPENQLRTRRYKIVFKGGEFRVEEGEYVIAAVLKPDTSGVVERPVFEAVYLAIENHFGRKVEVLRPSYMDGYTPSKDEEKRFKAWSSPKHNTY